MSDTASDARNALHCYHIRKYGRGKPWFSRALQYDVFAVGVWYRQIPINIITTHKHSATGILQTNISVATDGCQQIWPTYAVIGWLTNPWTAALLWLVVQDVPQSFALQQKIDPVGLPHLTTVTFLKWQQTLDKFSYKTTNMQIKINLID